MRILQVVVGSRLHKLDGPDSDTDLKSIHLQSPFDPFDKYKQAIQHSKDNVSYELKHFCRLAVKGNPTALEVLWSDIVQHQTALGDTLRAKRMRFIDTEAVRKQCLGYARGQLVRWQEAAHAAAADAVADNATASLYELGSMYTKPLVHRLRVLEQGLTLVREGWFPVVPLKLDMLRELKFQPTVELVTQAVHECGLLEQQLRTVKAHAHVPDYEWIRRFCRNAYQQVF